MKEKVENQTKRAVYGTFFSLREMVEILVSTYKGFGKNQRSQKY